MADKLRVVLAGCGGISGAWLDPVRKMPDVEIVGLVDIREEAAAQRREKYELAGAAVGTDLRKMLRKLKPDLVFDCTVPEAHMGVTLAALKAGCHVLGEKPLADTLPHARRMIAAARKAGRTYAVMQNRRADPKIAVVRDFLASGRLGKITTINCDFSLGPHFGGFREQRKHVLLLDMAIHTFDAARFMSRADAVSVYCKDWNPSGSWYSHGASAMAIFDMTDGLVFNYRGSWCAQGLPTTWESSWRIIGERGTLVWNGAAEVAAQVATDQIQFFAATEDVPVPIVADAKPLGHGGIIADYIRCLRTGGTPDTVCWDNVKSLAMVLAAIESSEKGKVVPVRA